MLLALVARPMATFESDASDLDRSRRRVLQEVDASQQRALAASGAPEDDDHLTAVDLEVDVLQDLERPRSACEAP